MLHDPFKRSLVRGARFTCAVKLALPLVVFGCAEGEPLDAGAFGGGLPTQVTVGTTTGNPPAGVGGASTGASTTASTTATTSSATTGPGTGTGGANTTSSGGAGGAATTGSGGAASGSGGAAGTGGSSGTGGSGGRGTGGRGGSGGAGGGVTGPCTAPMWVATTAYAAGQKVSLNGKEYTARFYTQGDNPETHHEPQNGPVQGLPWTYPTDC